VGLLCLLITLFKLHQHALCSLTNHIGRLRQWSLKRISSNYLFIDLTSCTQCYR